MLLVVIMSRNKITLQIILLLSMRKLNLWTGYMPRGYIQLHGLICRRIEHINSKNMKKNMSLLRYSLLSCKLLFIYHTHTVITVEWNAFLISVSVVLLSEKINQLAAENWRWVICLLCYKVGHELIEMQMTEIWMYNLIYPYIKHHPRRLSPRLKSMSKPVHSLNYHGKTITLISIWYT